MNLYNKGIEYEDKIYNILLKKRLVFPGTKPGKSSKKEDISFSLRIKMEEKKDLKADFGQKFLEWNKKTQIWKWSKTDEVTELYDTIGILKYLNKKKFVPKKHNIPDNLLTKADKKFDILNFEDSINIENKPFEKYYNKKNCYYIQIGAGYGFYHISRDKYYLGTPKLKPTFTLRLRAKTIHSTPIYNYRFLAVLKIKNKPRKSNLNIEENKNQKFPLPIVA